jgi:hypothetical protein
MRLSVPALLAVAVDGCTVQSKNVGTVSQVAGAYELIICNRACSFSNRESVFATARVMLFDRVLTLEEMKRINPVFIDTHDVKAYYEVNAQAGAQSYLRTGANIGTWEANGSTLRFNLFRSPDAGYAVAVERAGNLLRGSGQSWGFGMSAPPKEYGPDVVVGRRVGPPDSTKCRAKA